MSAFLVPDS